MSFTASELKRHVEQELDETKIPDGHNGAFVTYVDMSGVRTAIALRTEHGWVMAGDVGYHPHEDGLSLGFNLMRTW